MELYKARNIQLFKALMSDDVEEDSTIVTKHLRLVAKFDYTDLHGTEKTDLCIVGTYFTYTEDSSIQSITGPTQENDLDTLNSNIDTAITERLDVLKKWDNSQRKIDYLTRQLATYDFKYKRDDGYGCDIDSIQIPCMECRIAVSQFR